MRTLLLTLFGAAFVFAVTIVLWVLSPEVDPYADTTAQMTSVTENEGQAGDAKVHPLTNQPLSTVQTVPGSLGIVDSTTQEVELAATQQEYNAHQLSNATATPAETAVQFEDLSDDMQAAIKELSPRDNELIELEEIAPNIFQVNVHEVHRQVPVVTIDEQGNTVITEF